MEILTPLQPERPALKAVLFDFDGTLSTLRFGWEEIMEPMMLEFIVDDTEIDEGLRTRVKSYIDQSTGIQTYYQMEWLANEVKAKGRNPDASFDPWWYKDEYNRRLMLQVSQRREQILSGKTPRENYLIEGGEALLQVLCDKGIAIYVASGTDHEDVNEEARILGLDKYFTEIVGAPSRKAECSKDAVIRKLIDVNKLQGQEVAVFGDGKVEIRLGNEARAITIGVATDEAHRRGVNPVKRERLVAAGANVIIGDFNELEEILNWLKLD
jgi:phosphoglycolate phosphatase-like HAD superfamily hydrolase